MVLKIIQQKLKDFELSALSRWFPYSNDVPFRLQFSHYQYQEQRSSNLRFVFFFGCCCDVLCLKPYGQGLLWLWFTVWKRRWRWRIGRGGAGLPGLRIVDLILNARTKIIITITGVWKGAQEFWVSKSFHEKVAKELITPRFLSKHILDYHFYI